MSQNLPLSINLTANIYVGGVNFNVIVLQGTVIVSLTTLFAPNFSTNL
jgi:hypothetical protein